MHRFDVRRIHPDSVTYLDLRCGVRSLSMLCTARRLIAPANHLHE
jgi:hypothetical protein